MNPAQDSSTLRTSELLDILELLTSPIAIVDSAGVIQHASVTWRVRVAGAGLNLLPGARFGHISGNPIDEAIAQTLAGQCARAEVEYGTSDGQLHFVVRACRFGGERGALLEIQSPFDPSYTTVEVQQMVGALRERELQFAAIAANLPGILYRVVLHADGSIDFPYISPDTSTIVNRPAGEHWIDRIHPDDRAEFFDVLRSSAEQLLPFDLEQRVIGVAGQNLWVRNITRPHRRPDGAVVWDGMVLDITAQKGVEQDLQRSLREKDALLQEVHHRVKNNLQIISSLLDLQALTTPDPLAQRAFSESQRRIHAMALVHEQLYHVETMSQIDFGAYVRTLVDYLQQSFAPLTSQIHVVIDIEGIWLDANAAIPCGLIINELVSNAYKHAFPNHRSGQIRIICAPGDGGELVLTVADTGVGFAPATNRRPEALGLKLVRTLVRQLHGQLTTEEHDGVSATISFRPGRTQRDL